MIAIFGEAEIGSFKSLITLNSIPELTDKLGRPTKKGIGIHMAIQAILYDREILYYRIPNEEEPSCKEYLHGLNLLGRSTFINPLVAIALPAVNHRDILYRAKHLCHHCKILFLPNERDLYNFISYENSQ